MQPAENHLFQVLKTALNRKHSVPENPLPLSARELGDIFINTLYLAGLVQVLIGQHWLLTHNLKKEEPAFSKFVTWALKRELAPLGFLAPLWNEITLPELKVILQTISQLISQILTTVSQFESPKFREFLAHAVPMMNWLCDFEDEMLDDRNNADVVLQKRLATLSNKTNWTQARPSPNEGFLPAVAYRAFDAMDEIFQLHFDKDHEMAIPGGTGERLYEGGGAGVQTSYAQIFSAIKNLQLKPGARVVDLGSGFGRVGLIVGLCREDLFFTGYEFVSHRVQISNDSAKRAGISSRVQFLEQDLSQPNFRIPLADAYYMYDPFSLETYQTVISQLNSLSANHSMTVVTKADAGNHFIAAMAGGNWAPPEKHDSGMLLLFRSHRFMAQ